MRKGGKRKSKEEEKKRIDNEWRKVKEMRR